jgi:hypothetical protein
VEPLDRDVLRVAEVEADPDALRERVEDREGRAGSTSGRPSAAIVSAPTARSSSVSGSATMRANLARVDARVASSYGTRSSYAGARHGAETRPISAAAMDARQWQSAAPVVCSETLLAQSDIPSKEGRST